MDIGDWSVLQGVTVVKVMAVIERQECVSATLAGSLMSMILTVQHVSGTITPNNYSYNAYYIFYLYDIVQLGDMTASWNFWQLLTRYASHFTMHEVVIDRLPHGNVFFNYTECCRIEGYVWR